MRLAILTGLLLLTTGCGRGNREAQALQTFNVAEPPPAAQIMPREFADQAYVSEQDARQPRAADAAALPQIAYTYTIGYRVGAARVGEVQRRHVALCETLGVARCRLVAMSRDSGDGGTAQAALSLLVDARIARPFQDRLDAAAAGAGGDVSTRGMEAEDLSKQMVDTAAKVRGKEALAKRLLALLDTRGGKVGELVEAEKAYGQTQEELDATRSWLAEMQGRVTMSKIDISYAGAVPGTQTAWSPLGEALRDAGRVLGSSLAKLVTLLLAALPWLLFLALLLWALRRRGWRLRLRWPRRRRPEPVPA